MDYSDTRPVSALAPMAAVSHEALRRTIERFGGCDEYFTEMIQASSLVAGGKFEPYYIRTGPAPEKIVWQLTGGKAQPLGDAARILAALGGKGLDLNMGCCAPEIVRQGAGISWMLKDRDETSAMVRGVAEVLNEEALKSGGKPLRLSVKLRLGADDFSLDGLLSFCAMLIEQGVTLITLHPRTRHEKFRRTARWEYVYLLARELPVPVYGNGDISDAAAAMRVLFGDDESAKVPKCAGVMIGRGAVRSPWLFSQLAKKRDAQSFAENEESVDLLETGLRFLDDLKECQPEEFLKTRAQRFFSYFCGNLTFAEYLRVKISNAPDYETIKTLFTAYFDEMPQDRYATI